MPTRMLRDGILDSERVNRLDEEEENFYRRLMSIVDDYGRFEANKAKIRARLYPLKLDAKSEQRIGDLLLACVRERLVYVYRAGGKICLQLLNFQQQMRSKSKCPPPDEAQLITFAQQMLTPAQQQQLLSDAQQMITNAHLGVFVFGVVGEGVVEDRSRSRVPSGPGAEPTTTTKTSRKDRKPSNLEAVIAHGSSIGLPEDECRKFYRYNSRRKWKGGPAGETWAELLVVWKQRADERAGSGGASGKNSSEESPAEFDATKPHAHTGGLASVN